MVRKVIWPLPAQTQLAEIYKYILKSSYQNAEKVKADILASSRKLPANPEMYPADKYRKDNDGSFRAYELYHYRIAYRITEQEIIIVRVRHTAIEPRNY
ncbi:MAG: type II toxin-antitoxin system RelE/ParE family toxin [Bacteroidota bacterium]|nr:type II toxin-antitoxin system RelE/ParE family toxin [Chitinophagaceae bacterium]MDZ4810740.1 type II toxin-antitoxin system RelE/ParE family toxin [Bacteroidota bacterium]